jgi:hypothetical protein
MENPPGIITRPGSLSVDKTVDRLRAMLEERKITLFSVIDHSGEAAKAKEGGDVLWRLAGPADRTLSPVDEPSSRV